MNEWIDCKDRMPPCGEFVIAYCAHAPIWSIVRWGGCEWWESAEEWHRYPRDFYSHWMPRPESPEPPKPAGPFSISSGANGWELLNKKDRGAAFALDVPSGMIRDLAIWLNRLWANK